MKPHKPHDAETLAYAVKLGLQPDDVAPFEDTYAPPPACRACGGALLPENRRIADGCPCNSPRGVNCGLVAKNTCTCANCDPAQTGSTRIGRKADEQVD